MYFSLKNACLSINGLSLSFGFSNSRDSRVNNPINMLDLPTRATGPAARLRQLRSYYILICVTHGTLDHLFLFAEIPPGDDHNRSVD